MLKHKYNILVITQYYYPEQFRITDVCEKLANDGNNVTVLTGLPNYPEGIVKEEYRKFRRRKEKINDVTIIRSFLFGRGNGAARLFLNYLSFMISAIFKKRKLSHTYDAVFVYQISPVTQIYPAYVYAKKFKCPLIVNCQDVWPEVIKVYGIKENSLLFKLVKKYSIYLYEKADKILVSSQGFTEYLTNVCNVELDKIKYLPNHAESFYTTFENNVFKNDKVHLMFAGNIGIAQNLITLINAVTLIPENLQSQLIVDIVGDGSYMNEFKDIVENKELDDIFQFHGKKRIDELKYYYELADAYIMTLEGGTFVSRTVPSKLQGYMGAGKPILAAIDGEAQKIIKESNCGLYCNAGDFEKFSKILIDFISNVEKYREMGNNGREFYFNNYTIKIYIKRLIELINEEG